MAAWEGDIDATPQLASLVRVQPVPREIILTATTILAASKELGGEVVHSEDLNHGQDYPESLWSTHPSKGSLKIEGRAIFKSYRISTAAKIPNPSCKELITPKLRGNVRRALLYVRFP